MSEQILKQDVIEADPELCEILRSFYEPFANAKRDFFGGGSVSYKNHGFNFSLLINPFPSY